MTTLYEILPATVTWKCVNCGRENKDTTITHGGQLMLCPAPCGKGHPVTIEGFPEKKRTEYPDMGTAIIEMTELSNKSIKDGKPRRFTVR